MKKTRRSILTAAGATGTLSLAGCLSNFGDDSDDDDGDTNDTENNDTDDNETDDNDTNGENGTSDPTPDPTNDGVLEDLPGEAVVNFEATDQWMAMTGQGEVAVEDSDVYAGSQSLKLTAGEDVNYAGAYAPFPEGLDLSEKNLSIAVKYTGRQQFNVTVQLLAPNSQNVLSHRRTLTGPPDQWQRVDIGVNDVGTQPYLPNVQEIRVLGRRRGSEEGSIEFMVDDLRTVNRPERGAVMLLFDGTLESHYTDAFDVVDEFGFVGVESVIPETVGGDGRLTLDVMREMRDAGWDMAARPRTGARFLNDFSSTEQEGLIRQTIAYLENRGFEDGARTFVTPKNLVGPETMEHVREYHEMAFRYGGAPNALPATDPHNLGTLSGRAGDDTSYFVDMAAQHKQLTVLRFEDMGDDGFSKDDLRTLLEYIDAQDVDVVSASDLLDQ